MSDNKLQQAALAYAEKFQWAVFPLVPRDKNPLTDNGYKDATTDPETIKSWWTRWPTANIGVACGASGLVVIDLDIKPDIDGRESWRLLKLVHHVDDDTVIGLTGGGGQHLVFSGNGYDIRNSQGALARGVDVRANGGYIVAPPSIHPNGREYAWDIGAHPVDRKPSPLPKVLADLLTAGKPEPFAMPDSLPEGTRDTNIFRLACSLRAKGIGKDAAMAACLAENETKGKPPLPESQVRAKVENVYAKYSYREHAQPLGAKIPKDNAEAIAAQAPDCPDPELRQLVLDVLLGDPEDKTPISERRAFAGQLTLDWLAAHGGFIQSETGGDLYYYFQSAGQVFNLETDRWRAWLYALTGANPARTDYAYLLADCKTRAILSAPKRAVVKVAAWDDENQVLRISRFDGMVYALDGESIASESNGQNAIFEDNPLWLPYNPDFSNGHAVRWSTELPNWEKPDKAAAYSLAFRAWVVGTFFCELCPTRPLIAFIGEKGSGKSMALRVFLRLLFGPVGQVSGVPDKPDGFTAAAAAAHVLVLDNLDNFTGWLRDKLALVSTGGKDEHRKLYTSKEVGQVVYRCWVGLTSRTPDTLRRDDLADRLLLLPVARIDRPSPERDFLAQADDARNYWWGDLLTILNGVVARIRKGDLASTSALRMADWESLGRVLAQAENAVGTWDSFIEDLERSQNEFLLEDDLIVDALALWIENEDNHKREVLAKDLYSEWTRLLFDDKQPTQDWPKSPKSLGRKLASIRRSLRAYYKAEWFQGVRGRTYYQFQPKQKED